MNMFVLHIVFFHCAKALYSYVCNQVALQLPIRSILPYFIKGSSGPIAALDLCVSLCINRSLVRDSSEALLSHTHTIVVISYMASLHITSCRVLV